MMVSTFNMIITHLYIFLRQNVYLNSLPFLFFKDFINLFPDRGEGKEKERERNISVWWPLMHPHLGPGLQPRHVP